MALSTELIAALAGAGAGAVSTIVITWGSSVVHRWRRAKAIKVALYHEIFGHNILEVDPSPQGDPNFVLLGFSRAVYDAYLDEIPDLLSQRLVGTIAMYYTRLTNAASQQRQIDSDAAKSIEVTLKLIDIQKKQADPTAALQLDPDEIALRELATRQVGDRLSKTIVQNRILLAVAKGQQEQLLEILQEEFSYDPANESVTVLSKYRVWLTKVTQGALTKGQPMSQSDDKNDPKDVAFYSAVAGGWIDTKMERDRTIVTLSSGAIGLLVTLLTTVGVKTLFTLWLYAGALVGFGVAAICTIVIFQRNATYLEKVVQGTTSASKMLGWLDRITLIFFGLGIILMIVIGATAARNSLH